MEKFGDFKKLFTFAPAFGGKLRGDYEREMKDLGKGIIG
jgi:hypothetical protein